MKIITETALRDLYKNDKFESFVLNKGEKLTPAAAQFLTDRRIRVQDYNQSHGILPKEGFICLPSGRHVTEKPEHYTHLRGNILVKKSHPVIRFRGQLDLLEANFITCINQAVSSGYQEMADELNIIFLYLQEIMRAEVRNKPLPFIDFKGWSDAEVREYSHHPEKYFGVKHALPDPKNGALYGEVNLLRAMIRQLEIAAVEAFSGEEEAKCERLDIILALNRLSSLVYIIICKLIGGHYKVKVYLK
jgi:ethanolamine utilization cobalamin adenosyltransferase